jgi:predicted amidohydrolase
MKVAAIQMASGPIVEGNLREAARLIAHAADDGAKLVVLPENFALMALHDGDRLNAAESDEGGPVLQRPRRARGALRQDPSFRRAAR